MDDPNYKMKNIYSSVSPSEIALRCTILDLCQRLKRTEVLCDYYEQCRNELVSDCIRLRQERDYYLMAHRNNLQRSEACKPKSNPANNSNSNPNTGPPVDTNQLRQSNKIQPSFSFEKEIDFTKTTEPDDNYEEIAKRLIAQFREEMEEIRRASLNGPQQSTSSNQNEIVATGSQVLKGRPTQSTNYPVDSSTMPTMLASPITPARQSSQQTVASNCDDVSNSTKLLLSDVPGCTSGKPPPPPPPSTTTTTPVTNPVYLSKKMTPTSTTTNDPTINSEYDEKIVIYDVLEDVQRAGGGGNSGVIGGSRYYQSNQGITKRDSTSEAIDKLPSPYDVSSSSSAYNRNQQLQGHHYHHQNHHHQQQQHHHNLHHPHHQNRQRHVNSSNNEFQKEIENANDFRDVPTVIEVNSNRDNFINPMGGGYERPGGDNIQPQESTSHLAAEYFDLVNKVLKNSINDFDTLTRILMNQNEKLRKLKGKQLRNYFKRQLDQNNETSNIPKRP
ncbi:homeobox protein 12-like isoform X2 [Panonychus citri]|uniref:homeobox protein 12-like isoform X2 n=1 Tax=Panonychus citri TaxID=50023 RepID=UPI002307FD56|nr:homeobox protein 12-like isoform X2 [Panonychus citri]